jgi:hypothetical protein
VAQAVKNCEQHLLEKLSNCYQRPLKADNPFPVDYCPEMDISDPLNHECLSFYQHLIGVMGWMIELGHVDIATEISFLSSHLAYPCVGHLEVALHVVGYLKQKHNTRLVFDRTYLTIDMDSFPQYDRTEFYGDVEEAIPSDLPTPLGKDLDVCMMCDSDHAGEKQTHHSHTGFLIFCNMALIDWVSKKQATIETFVFGDEFAAMKHSIENRGSINYFGQNNFAPNATFRVVSCIYILYDLTYLIWLKNSTHSLSYMAYRCITVLTNKTPYLSSVFTTV